MQAEKRKKVAVVLSGGGAKGVAHISVLKYLEAHNIPVDIVVGTSMGSIIGGMYALGYSASQMDSIVRVQNWKALLTDGKTIQELSLTQRLDAQKYLVSIPLRGKRTSFFTGVVEGKKVLNLFRFLSQKIPDSIDFNKLPIPFACVAHDLVTGKEVVFHTGNLPLAMRASMSIPGVFTPIPKDSMLLVDGGLSNNYPADVAKAMGADIIIGVSVMNELLKKDELTTLPKVIGQIVDHACKNKLEENIAMTDFYIPVDVNGFSSASFNKPAIDSLLRRGDEAVEKCLVDLEQLPKLIGLSPEDIVHRPKSIDVGALHSLTDSLRLNTPESSINGSMRFDSEELAAILLNTTLFWRLKALHQLKITTRLGQRSSARLDYSLSPYSFGHFQGAFQIDYNDINLYNKGERVVNTTFSHSLLEGSLAQTWRTIQIKLGVGYDNFHYYDLLSKESARLASGLRNESFLNYFLRLNYYTYNKKNYPTNGMKWKFDYNIITTDFLQFKKQSPVHVVSAFWEGAFSFSDRFTLLPNYAGRVMMTTRNLSILSNTIGIENGRYINQQIGFAGINRIEEADNVFMKVGLELRQRFFKNNYLILASDYGFSTRKSSDLYQGFVGEQLWGLKAGYGIKTMLGPLELFLSHSNRTDKLSFFISAGFVF